MSKSTRCIFALLLAAIISNCDSGTDLDLETPTNQDFGLIQAAQHFYKTSLEQEQSLGLSNKLGHDSTTAAVLAAMVRKYPPDWSQAVAWR